MRVPLHDPQSQQQLSEATMMARNRNRLANRTMHALQFITVSFPKPFVMPMMVGRIAAMLNYALKQLVGPRRRELKVIAEILYLFSHMWLINQDFL